MDEQKFILLFNRGFEEVVLPAIENMGEEIKSELKADFKKEIGGLKLDVNSLKAGYERMEHKLDIIVSRQLTDESTLGDHAKRIKKLETKRVAA